MNNFTEKKLKQASLEILKKQDISYQNGKKMEKNNE